MKKGFCGSDDTAKAFLFSVQRVGVDILTPMYDCISLNAHILADFNTFVDWVYFRCIYVYFYPCKEWCGDGKYQKRKIQAACA